MVEDYRNQAGACATLKTSTINAKFNECEDAQTEIQGRIDTLLDRLNTVLMPECPQPTGSDANKVPSPMLPPMGERLAILNHRQRSTINVLSDILQRLEV